MLATAIAGCGKPSDGVAVNGKATFRGEAIAGGAITFFAPSGRPVIASISEQGEYATVLEPGEYTVIVNVGVKLPPGFKESDPLPPPKFQLPPEYTNRAKSTLKATVSPDQSEPIDFRLE
jgi:hypothetical protein